MALSILFFVFSNSNEMKIIFFSLGFRVRNFGNISRDDDDDDDCDDDKACDDDDDGCKDDEDDEAGFLVVFIAHAGIFGQNS